MSNIIFGLLFVAILGYIFTLRQNYESSIVSYKKWNSDLVFKLISVQILSKLIDHYESLKTTFTEKVIMLQMIQMSPIVIIISILWKTGDGILVFSSFQIISMIILPYLYCQAYKIKMDIKEKFTKGPMDMKSQIIAGAFLFCAVLFVMVTFYHVSVNMFGPELYLKIRIPLKLDLFHQFQFCVIFCGINPILEELFWRCFVGELIGESQKAKLFAAANFGFYHFFVLYYIFQEPLMPLFIVGVITFYGRLLHFGKDFIGLMVAILGHLGADIGVCVMIYEISKLKEAQIGSAF